MELLLFLFSLGVSHINFEMTGLIITQCLLMTLEELCQTTNSDSLRRSRCILMETAFASSEARWLRTPPLDGSGTPAQNNAVKVSAQRAAALTYSPAFAVWRLRHNTGAL
jgi:hypothetical protein